MRDLRAARDGQLTRRGRTHAFVADELPVDARPPVIAAYRESVGREVERYFDRLPDAADHPVFLVDAEV
ncbi:MAG TPA: hypothetical protein VK951_03815 [Miltoncostaeaceae bacterium]|nr:hypothetical protein [Miltoncostaeaceae bacterium]